MKGEENTKIQKASEIGRSFQKLKFRNEKGREKGKYSVLQQGSKNNEGENYEQELPNEQRGKEKKRRKKRKFYKILTVTVRRIIIWNIMY